MDATAVELVPAVLLDEKIQPHYEQVVRRNPGEPEFHQSVRDVLGSRGYGPLGAVLLGSVSNTRVRESNRPVILVPRPQG